MLGLRSYKYVLTFRFPRIRYRFAILTKSHHAPLAQLVEHAPVKRGVVGSCPTRCATKPAEMRVVLYFMKDGVYHKDNYKERN